jgi:hypothetical protein
MCITVMSFMPTIEENPFLFRQFYYYAQQELKVL